MASVTQAAVFMMERWPEPHGPRYRAALQACTGRLTSNDDVENARCAFLAAANEADLLVKNEDEDADWDQAGDRRAAPPSPSDQKRRERARMEEEEDFLVPVRRPGNGYYRGSGPRTLPHGWGRRGLVAERSEEVEDPALNAPRESCWRVALIVLPRPIGRHRL